MVPRVFFSIDEGAGSGPGGGRGGEREREREREREKRWGEQECERRRGREGGRNVFGMKRPCFLSKHSFSKDSSFIRNSGHCKARRSSTGNR